ncbi:growth hormone secretagogue receptor type 1-like [Biomphalaria glabrata]|uniref:Growth hormone secretagogue receptor type 1-like n=1 Tax=Biomphalaria glabrata TaxID=6526 RepID=A0A9U8EHU6_BIOGL|nr:growth hormone secretagogue receptor type 1-like [Biomphalaria glabrata]
MTQENLNASLILKQIDLFDPLMVDWVIVTLNLISGEVIGLVGIIANAVTIVVFCKLGFYDSVDVTLTALAISDIGSLVSLQFYNIMTNPWISSVQLPFEASEVVVLMSMYPHVYFIRVSGLITAFAALERCVCVVLPLKVKTIFSCKRSILIILIIFLISISNVVAPYYFFYFDWIFSPERNSTILRMNLRENWHSGIGLSFMINDVFIQYSTFAVLITCTVITSVNLNKNAAWKKSISKGDRQNVETKISPKEVKVARMLSLVSVTFVVCLLPLSATITAVGVVKDMTVGGPYFQVARICNSVSFLTETVSSSMNGFIYYKMSSKYRKTCKMLFVRGS